MSTIAITGANRGIGLALARQFIERGDRVVAICREPSEQLKTLDARVESGIDVTDRAGLAELNRRLQDTTIDVLINNAGVMRPTDFEHIEDQLDAFRVQFEVNALAPLRVTRALLDRLGEGAKVTIVTSRMGSIADCDTGGHYGYRMSKTAVNMAGMCLAHELEGRGIAVGLLHPGYVKTDMTGHTGHIDPEQSAAGLIRRIDELSLATTGSFRHQNGEALPW